MSDFKRLMRRADQEKRHESDPLKESWWAGYIRGLRYAHYQATGQQFGSAAEHALFLAAASLPAPELAALGQGYRVGLEMREDAP
jgi:hypothetical protein